MNSNRILDENMQLDKDLKIIIQKLDEYLKKTNKLNTVYKNHDKIEECNEDLEIILNSNGMNEAIYNYNIKIQEIGNYLGSINYEIRVKYPIVEQQMKMIYDMIMNMRYLDAQIDVCDENLNEFMIKIQGKTIWQVNKMSVYNMQCFKYLSKNEKVIFEFIWCLQKVRYLKSICINMISFIKLVNCNYIEKEDKN